MTGSGAVGESDPPNGDESIVLVSYVRGRAYIGMLWIIAGQALVMLLAVGYYIIVIKVEPLLLLAGVVVVVLGVMAGVASFLHPMSAVIHRGELRLMLTYGTRSLQRGEIRVMRKFSWTTYLWAPHRALVLVVVRAHRVWFGRFVMLLRATRTAGAEHEGALPYRTVLESFLEPDRGGVYRTPPDLPTTGPGDSGG